MRGSLLVFGGGDLLLGELLLDLGLVGREGGGGVQEEGVDEGVVDEFVVDTAVEVLQHFVFVVGLEQVGHLAQGRLCLLEGVDVVAEQVGAHDLGEEPVEEGVAIGDGEELGGGEVQAEEGVFLDLEGHLLSDALDLLGVEGRDGLQQKAVVGELFDEVLVVVRRHALSLQQTQEGGPVDEPVVQTVGEETLLDTLREEAVLSHLDFLEVFEGDAAVHPGLVLAEEGAESLLDGEEVLGVEGEREAQQQTRGGRRSLEVGPVELELSCRLGRKQSLQRLQEERGAGAVESGGEGLQEGGLGEEDILVETEGVPWGDGHQPLEEFSLGPVGRHLLPHSQQPPPQPPLLPHRPFPHQEITYVVHLDRDAQDVRAGGEEVGEEGLGEVGGGGREGEGGEESVQEGVGGGGVFELSVDRLLQEVVDEGVGVVLEVGGGLVEGILGVDVVLGKALGLLQLGNTLAGKTLALEVIFEGDGEAVQGLQLFLVSLVQTLFQPAEHLVLLGEADLHRQENVVGVILLVLCQPQFVYVGLYLLLQVGILLLQLGHCLLPLPL